MSFKTGQNHARRFEVFWLTRRRLGQAFIQQWSYLGILFTAYQDIIIHLFIAYLPYLITLHITVVINYYSSDKL